MKYVLLLLDHTIICTGKTLRLHANKLNKINHSAQLGPCLLLRSGLLGLPSLPSPKQNFLCPMGPNIDKGTSQSAINLIYATHQHILFDRMVAG